MAGTASLTEITSGVTAWRRENASSCRVSRVPPGHPEGYLEGFANIYSEAARAIFAKRKGVAVDPAVVYPTVDDGMKGMVFVDACVQSSKKNGGWVKV